MAVDDVQFMAALKGKPVKLTLKTSSYFGVVQRCNPNKTLVLTDVVVSSNGGRCPGPKLFFGREILNVEFVSEANSGGGDGHHHTPEEHLNLKRFQPYRKTVTLGDDEDEEDSINFEVIDEFYEKFGPAVMHIRKHPVIGVGAEGVEVLKSGRLCWLQISTKNKVYLFDVLLLGSRAFKNGLSMILESKHILKVIHDCRAIAGCLIGQFGVKLTNVFDTQVADVMCFYSETGGFLPDRVTTLQEVVSVHLKVPPSQLSSFQMKSQLTKEEREIWKQRPCPLPLLKMMALSVIHLQPLRLVLLDTLMTDYMAAVDSYLSSSYCQPDDLEHESVLELPSELRQLDQMRQERQKSASSRYPVTERGLLARFNPQPQSSSQTSPAAEDRSKIQPDFFEPSIVESRSSPQRDLLVNQPSTSPLSINSVSSIDICASPNSSAQVLIPATVSDRKKQMSPNSPLSAGGDRGCIEALMDVRGRGRPLGKEQPYIPALPAIGRGFLLQLPPAQVPGESTGDIKTPARVKMAPSCSSHALTQERMHPPGCHDNDLPKDICGLRGEPFTATPQSPPSSLTHSFRSFRY